MRKTFCTILNSIIGSSLYDFQLKLDKVRSRQELEIRRLQVLSGLNWIKLKRSQNKRKDRLKKFKPNELWLGSLQKEIGSTFVLYFIFLRRSCIYQWVKCRQSVWFRWFWWKSRSCYWYFQKVLYTNSLRTYFKIRIVILTISY